MDINSLAERAAQHAGAGHHEAAAADYQELLRQLDQPHAPVDAAQKPQLIRSIAFNLAQVLNHLGRYQQALPLAERGLGLNPSAFGRAIGLAAKGEALCGLGRDAEGMQAFDLATAAHPVVGRLNSADSLSRLPSSHHWDAAEQRVNVVVTSFASQLNDDLRAEADTIRGKVAARRGDLSGARKIWEGVVSRYPHYADARLQLSRGTAGSRPAKASAAVPAPKRSLFSWILGK